MNEFIRNALGGAILVVCTLILVAAVMLIFGLVMTKVVEVFGLGELFLEARGVRA